MLAEIVSTAGWGPILLALGLVLPAGITGQVPGPPARSSQGSSDWAAVDRIMGREGKVAPGGVHRYSFPRSDLRVQVHGVVVKPAFALGSWVAFEGTGTDALAMGDLVLSASEVTPVLASLQQLGIQETAPQPPRG